MFRTISRATLVEVTVTDEGDTFATQLGVLREVYTKDDKMQYSSDAAERIVRWFHRLTNGTQVSVSITNDRWANNVDRYRVGFTRVVEEVIL